MARKTDDRSTSPRSGRWILRRPDGLGALEYEPTYEPTYAQTEQDLGPEDVLVDLHAASLNHRDLIIANVCAVLWSRPAN